MAPRPTDYLASAVIWALASVLIGGAGITGEWRLFWAGIVLITAWILSFGLRRG